MGISQSRPLTRSFAFKDLIITVEYSPIEMVSGSRFQTLQRNKKDRQVRVTAQDVSESSLRATDSGVKVVAPGFLMQIGVTVRSRKEMAGRYRVGLVQKVDQFFSQHDYVDEKDRPTGYARWEMRDKEDCIDSDVSENMPFYSKRGFFEFEASYLNTNVEMRGYLYMDDLPYTKATWKLDLESIGQKGNNFLKKMVREEQFLTWLVVQNVDSGEIQPLFVIVRGFQYNIAVSCVDKSGRERSTEERAKVCRCSTKQQLVPTFTFDPCLIPPLPDWVSQGPLDKHKTANDTMKFVWYKHKDKATNTVS
jgi:hypothetical protein